MIKMKNSSTEKNQSHHMNQKNHSLDNVPELRFPEFVDDGEWKYLNGDKLFDPITNKNHNSDLPILAITQEHGAIPRDLIDYNVSVTDKSIESYKVVEEGDFIISLRSFQGGIEYSNYLGLCSPAYIILRKKIELENHFYRQYFKSTPFIFDLNRNLEGIRDGKMVSYKQFSEILIPNPRFQEQQKIASCLSSLDELISAHSQKLELLKDHKKGLMQNLFPQEGETVPKYRFPEFEGDGEWVENELSEFCFNISSGKDKNHDNGAFELYGSTGVIGRTDSLSYQGDYILVARVGANAGFLNRVKGQFGVTDNTLVINLKENDKIDFIFYSLDKIGLNKLIFGSGQPLVTGTQLKDLIIPTPKNKKEQQKIASCLSAVDELIAAQGEKIEQLKLHKKGLMQGLFPKAV